MAIKLRSNTQPVVESSLKTLAALTRQAVKCDLPYNVDPFGFIFNCCYSVDEADPVEKLKLIPDLPHTRLMIQRVLVDRVHPLLMPKSRRMIVTWTMTACEVWQAMMHEHQGIFVQSKKFEDSCELVNRHWEILKNLPSDIFPVNQTTDDTINFKCGIAIKRYRGGRGHTAKIEFSNGSFIQALAEGKDQLRQYGASFVRQEEISFWDKQEESYDAAIECVTPPPGSPRGGQLVAVSTANPSWFGMFVNDEDMGETGQRKKRKLDYTIPIEGVREWTTHNGCRVLEIHYKADPAKRAPDWIKRAKIGKRKRGWDREMEIRWDIYSGMPVFGDCFDESIHISAEPLAWDHESTIVRLWDYGNTPCCTFSTVVNGQWQWLAEICTDMRPMGSKEPPPTSNIGRLAADVLALCALRFPGTAFLDFDDPAGDQKTQTDSRSCRDVLNEKRIYPTGGEVSTKGRIEAMAGWLSRYYGKPAVLIDEQNCPMLAEGMRGGYRYAEIGQTGKYQQLPEKNQYSHPIDAQCYGASRLTWDTDSISGESEDIDYYEQAQNRAGRYY